MSVKRAHILQHVPFEGPGYIAQWLAAHGAEVTTTAWYEAGAELPALADIDLVLCLGGPMSVHDNARYPWLHRERAFLRDAIRHELPTLGICLGAQQMSLCMGGEVSANPVREIGWFELAGHSTEAGAPQVFNELVTFHWHGECFSLPESAQLLASSAACEVQAALLGKRALALQCHLEMLPDGVAALLAQCGDELVPGPFVQDQETLASWPDASYSEMHAALTKLLAWLVAPR